MYPHEVIVQQSSGVYKVYDANRRVCSPGRHLLASLSLNGPRLSTRMIVGYCTTEKEIRELYAKPMKTAPTGVGLIPF